VAKSIAEGAVSKKSGGKPHLSPTRPEVAFHVLSCPAKSNSVVTKKRCSLFSSLPSLPTGRGIWIIISIVMGKSVRSEKISQKKLVIWPHVG
jgi:hypothetical protein